MISNNKYLTQGEMESNAKEIYTYLSDKGWTINAISGLLGNMQRESTINPGLWQSLKEGNYSGGYGLVQWTPATKYTNWAKANGYDIGDGTVQLYWIDQLSESTGEWIKTSAYNLTWSQFKTSTETPEYLASAYLKNFERAGVEEEEARRQYARSWYDFLESGVEPAGRYIVRFIPALERRYLNADYQKRHICYKECASGSNRGN